MAAFIEGVVELYFAVKKAKPNGVGLGIRLNFTLRLVVIPQAMRVIIPPLTSQYLNKKLIFSGCYRLSRTSIGFCWHCIKSSW